MAKLTDMILPTGQKGEAKDFPKMVLGSAIFLVAFATAQEGVKKLLPFLNKIPLLDGNVDSISQPVAAPVLVKKETKQFM